MSRTPERRIEQRYPIELGADVRFAGRSNCRGRVVNLGMNGIGLGRGGLPAGIRVGDSFRLGFRALEGDLSIRLSAGVVHIQDGVLGAVFGSLPVEVRQQLAVQLRILQRRLSARNKAQEALRLETEPLRRLMRRTALTEGRLMERIDKLLDGLQTHLLNAAASAVNDDQSQSLADEAAMLRMACREQALGHELCAELLRPLHGKSITAEEQGADGISVMDDRQADLWLARNYLVQSMQGRHGEVLAELERRLSGTAIPCAPETLADALLWGFDKAGISPDAAALGLRISVDLIGEDLGNFYTALLNAW